MRVNPDEFVSFPKEMVIGFIAARQELEPVDHALSSMGLKTDQVTYLQGKKGLEILTGSGESGSVGKKLVRKLEHVSMEGERLDQAVDQLKEGGTVVAIHQIEEDRAPDVRQALEDAGVAEHHYFGKRTFD